MLQGCLDEDILYTGHLRQDGQRDITGGYYRVVS